MEKWSESPLPSYKKRLFSNTQHRDFLLKAGDIVNVERNIALAFRCVTKPNFDATPVNFSYVVRMELANKSILNSDFSLYDELSAINTVEVMGIAEAAAEAEAKN